MIGLSAASGPDETDMWVLSGAFWTAPDTTVPALGVHVGASGGYSEGEIEFLFFD